MSEELKNTNQETLETQDSLENEEENLNETENEDLESELEDEEQEDLGQEDTVPLKAHLETKRKLREAKLKLEELEAAAYTEKVRAKRDAVKQKWLSKGYDDETASMMADDIAEVYGEISDIKTSRQESVIDEEIAELAEDEFYSNIMSYKNEIKNKIKRFRNVGENLTVEEAYLMVVGPRTKYRESNLKQQQKAIITNKKKGVAASKNNVATAASSGSKNQYPLDATDRKALAGLKKAQPLVGWTEKKYYEMYYGKN